MSDLPPEPTQDEVDQLRSAINSKLQENSGEFEAPDINRLRSDDTYIRRFLKHHDNDQKLALDMVFETLKFRADNNCNTLSVASFPKEFFDKGALYIHNRDKDGCQILIFNVSQHTKGDVDMSKLKLFLIYWMDRMERAEPNNWISVFFDMRNTGLRNMDMEFIQYMINLFKYYYPWVLNNILVFELPWILNAAWKIIKALLPAKSVNKIKFTDKKNINEFVAPDQCLVGWGGTDDYEYHFEPEKPSQSLPNGEAENARKVRFEGNFSPISPTVRIPGKRTLSSGGFEIEPGEELSFNTNRFGSTSNITLRNNASGYMVFKIKTTSPDKYRVKPSVGTLEEGGVIEVNVSLMENLLPQALVRDKFLIMWTGTDNHDLSTQELSQLFKTTPKDQINEVRLRVGVATPESSLDLPNGVAGQGDKSKEIMSKLDQIYQRQLSMELQIQSARRLMFFCMFIMMVILVVLVMTMGNMTSNLVMHLTQHLGQSRGGILSERMGSDGSFSAILNANHNGEL